MSLPRFLVPASLLRDTRVEVTGHELHHIRVRRVTIGERVVLFDGEGQMAVAELVHIDRRKACFQLRNSATQTTTRKPSISLGIALLKGSSMDLVIEKATELGVDNVRPYTAKRSVRLSVSPARHDRWRRIAENAAKQSQQVHVPELYDVCAYEDVLATTTEATRLILVEPELLPHALPLDILMAANRASTIVLVGPEGGLSAADLSLAVHYDFRPTSLGGSTLRAETAAIAAVAILSFLRNRNSPIACDERHADLQV